MTTTKSCESPTPTWQQRGEKDLRYLKREGRAGRPARKPTASNGPIAELGT